VNPHIPHQNKEISPHSPIIAIKVAIIKNWDNFYYEWKPSCADFAVRKDE